MTSAILSQSDLAMLVGDLVAARTRVIAPVPTGEDPRRTEYRPIARLEEAALGGALPRRSLKEFFFPPSEVLLRYRQKKDGVELREVPTTFAAQVILGARPCDAAGIATLDKVMGWDYRDELWFGRREATTIVGLACPGLDSLCFCTAVGLGPDSTKGLDVLLVPLERAAASRSQKGGLLLSEAVDAFLQDTEPFAGAAELEGSSDLRRPERAARYLARAVTPKGEALLQGRGEPFTDPADLEGAEEFARTARARIAKNLAIPDSNGSAPLDGNLEAQLGIAAADGGDFVLRTQPSRSAEQPAPLGRLPEWLAANFDHELWKSLALRCHGCGACTAVCPTCHCFDIVDEHDTYGRGARRRNWDFCQSAKFTLHASGHNPRASQTERFRQRVMHKFSIYPRRFDAILCTGCGRCARACGAGMNLPEILGRLVQLAGPDARGSQP